MICRCVARSISARTSTSARARSRPKRWKDIWSAGHSVLGRDGGVVRRRDGRAHARGIPRGGARKALAFAKFSGDCALRASLSCGQMPRESRRNGKLPTHDHGENRRSDMTHARGQGRSRFCRRAHFLKEALVSPPAPAVDSLRRVLFILPAFAQTLAPRAARLPLPLTRLTCSRPNRRSGRSRRFPTTRSARR